MEKFSSGFIIIDQVSQNTSRLYTFYEQVFSRFLTTVSMMFHERYGKLFVIVFDFFKLGYNTVLDFVKRDYNAEIFLCTVFIVVIVYVYTIKRVKSNTKSVSYIIRTTYSGYNIMSCENCSKIATYGSSRGGTGVRCEKHASNVMVKVFGCEHRGCNTRVVKGTIYCKKHI